MCLVSQEGRDLFLTVCLRIKAALSSGSTSVADTSLCHHTFFSHHLIVDSQKLLSP